MDDELVKLGFSIGTRRAAQRVAAVDAYEFPASVRQRVRLKQPDLGIENTALIEAAMRQWFRILARHPSAQLSMPSQFVDDMWHEFLLHTRDYAAFCDTAFGRFLHHEPESAMTPAKAAANRSERLLITLRLARKDENGSPVLPLLFRVDHETGLKGAHRYLADCGGRGQCHIETPDVVCLHHLAGGGRPKIGRSQDNSSWRYPHGGGYGGGGCGGGGGGDGGGSSGGGGGCGGGGG